MARKKNLRGIRSHWRRQKKFTLKKVLKGISLTVKRGQAVAVVGHSGSGKSSVINLISRYYDVFSGSVCLDDIDVRDLSVCWLRSQIGLVRQEPVLFNTTIRENIRYGRQSATDDEVEAAARQANAHQFIVKLPKMYETLVGERGTSLSGGQKQRIAIARALVRNPIVLLLDEATSALDTTSEAKVQLAIKKAAEGRTTVVVAHRLSTIRDVDLIHVMKQGEIVETGTHEQLMAAKGLYFDMVMLQEPNAMAQEAHTAVRMAESSELENEVQVVEEEKQSEVPQVSFWRMIALNSKQWRWLTVGIVCSIFIGFSMPMFIVAFGDLFGSMSKLDTNKMWEKVNKVSLVCSLIGAVTGICNLLEAVSFGIAGSRLTERLRTRMFAHILTQQLAYFDQLNNSTGALCAKLSSEASYVQGATGHRVGICLQGFGSIGLALVLAMWFEWRVGLVTLAALPLVALVVYQEMKTTREESYGNAKSLENSTKIAIEAVSNVRTVVSVGRERLFVEEYVAQLTPALNTATRSAHCKGLVEGLSRSMFNFINAAALTYGGHLMVNEGVAYENILVTTQSLQMASGQAQNAFSLAPHFEKGMSAASRVIALLNTEPTIKDPETPLVRPFISKGEASLKEVEFKYPSRPGVKVLRGLDLQVDKGKTIALVGRSGCGKSTVIQLLERYYDPDAGKVCLDNIPLRGLLISEARRSFGIVSQEPTLFDCSIAENIAYGDNETVATHAEIVDAAKLANIHNFVMSLPEGYDTNIGAKGTQLSGGQKQRVAIARALIRRPKILLLDEATSALDTESEKVVQESLKQAAEGRTCVMIAHRLSTVRDADLVCVIDAGVVSESGSHQQLLDAKGLYYKLHYNS